jgi:hypothetical protein
MIIEEIEDKVNLFIEQNNKYPNYLILGKNKYLELKYFFEPDGNPIILSVKGMRVVIVDYNQDLLEIGYEDKIVPKTNEFESNNEVFLKNGFLKKLYNSFIKKGK